MPRKTSRKSAAVAVVAEKTLDGGRVALPVSERRLSFGDRWNYAPAPEAHNYIKLKKRYQLFIGGKLIVLPPSIVSSTASSRDFS